MIYLDHGATSFPKIASVKNASLWAMTHCGNPGRGGYPASMEAARVVYGCRELASELFDCEPEQVVFTQNCTHGLNIAINSLVKPGSKVLISGFEHNAVTRPLHHRNVQTVVAGRKLFDWADTLSQFEDGLKSGVSAAVFTHCSNVFGYILPVEEMAQLCRMYRVPFVVDAAQSAGKLPVSLKSWGANYVAMPGHKGLLGPQGTGILLCGDSPKPLLQGGTGTESVLQSMPSELPERLEAGTVNVPGIAGLRAGLQFVKSTGPDTIFKREQKAAKNVAKGLKKMGYRVFFGENQGGTVSFVGTRDCQEIADSLAKYGIAVRAGLHCAPLAHESAGTLESGTVRVSFGHDATPQISHRFLQVMGKIHRSSQ